MSRWSRLTLAASIGLASVGAVAVLLSAVAAGAGEWTAGALGPSSVTEAGSARIGDRIYIVGGVEDPRATVDTVDRYDVASNSWETVAPMPRGVNHPGVAERKGILYVYGGFRTDHSDSPTDRLYRYDPDADDWDRLADSGLARGAVALEAIKGKLYAVGGAYRENKAIRRLQIYDISQDRWRKGPSLDVGRNHLASAVVDRKLYAIAGRAGDRNDPPGRSNYRTVERYNPNKERWKRLPKLGTGRSGGYATEINGRIAITGGEVLGYPRDPVDVPEVVEEAELYNPATKEWCYLPPMKTARHGLGVEAKEGTLYAIYGGPQSGFTFSNIVEFLPQASNCAP